MRAEAVRIALMSLVVAACSFAWAAFGAEPRVGRVAQVVDGRSLDVLLGAQRVRVRLGGIDAPSDPIPFGLRSRQSLVRLCGGEVATVQEHAKLRDGTVLARVTCSGADAAAEQVRHGFARVSATGHDYAHLRTIEAEARAARRGIWSVQAALTSARD